jgi:DNA-binding GntR family transcriptional regulator
MSRDTVSKALRLLETQGVLYSDHGCGTFVAPKAVRHMSHFLDGFSADMHVDSSPAPVDQICWFTPKD